MRAVSQRLAAGNGMPLQSTMCSLGRNPELLSLQLPLKHLTQFCGIVRPFSGGLLKRCPCLCRMSGTASSLSDVHSLPV